MSTTTQTCTLVTYEPPYLIARTRNSFRVLPEREFLSYPSLVANMTSTSTSALKTPSRSTRVMDPPSNTPQNKGAASDCAAGLVTTREHMYPFLKEDLKNERTITLDQFLTNILHLTPPSDDDQGAISRLASSRTYARLANKYKKAVPKAKPKQEFSLYEPFLNLINYAHNHIEKAFRTNKADKPSRFRYFRTETKPIGGSAASRKPDLVMTDDRCLKMRPVDDMGKKTLFWADLFGYIEFKVSHKKKKKGENGSQQHHSCHPRNSSTSQAEGSSVSRKRKADNMAHNGTDGGSAPKKPKRSHAPDVFDEEHPGLQCASYALELLSVGGWRSHVIGARITDQNMELLYFDRSAIVKSHPFDFVGQPELFLRIVRGLANLSKWEWGLHALFPCTLGDAKMRSCKVTRTGGNVNMAMYDDLKVGFHDGASIELGQTIALSHGLIGRGTCVVKVKRMSRPGKAELEKPCVAKFSWPAKERLNENDFVKTAWEMVRSNDEWKEMAHHLPEILYCADYDGKEDIQIALEKLSELEKWEVEYERRVLRVLVSTELFSLAQLTKAGEVYQVFYDVFRCYRWLYQVCHIMHRDVSHTNVMFRRVGGRVKGVLNDFDLASRVDGTVAQPTSCQRTGTRPFMALDLLQERPPLHVYRHDLESLFYVMVWQCCRFNNGEMINKPPYGEWADGLFEDARRAKREFLHPDTEQDANILVTDQHQPLEFLLLKLRDIFANGYSVSESRRRSSKLVSRLGRAAAPFDEATLGGTVSFDIIEKAFEEYTVA